MIKAVIFDMDGLLIDSEPLWKQAELDVLPTCGVPLTYEMTKETTGLRVDEMVEHWHSRYPWDTPSKQEVDHLIVARLIALVKESGVAMPGVDALVSMFAKEGLPMAIASSSSEAIIDAVMDKLKIHSKLSVIYSAEHEPFGKPHPGVYITTAEMLGVKPAECLAFEDSANGVLSAKAAKVKCVAVPDSQSRHDRKFGIADVTINSLGAFTIDMLHQLNR